MLHVVYLRVWASSVVSLLATEFESGVRGKSFSFCTLGWRAHIRELTTARCAFHKPFKLLSSHTPVFPSQKKVCRLSETQKTWEENIFFPKSYLFTSASWVLISRIVGCLPICLFYICRSRRGQGRGLAHHTAISSQSCGLLYIIHKQTSVQGRYNR